MLSKKLLSIFFVILVCSVNFYSQIYISGQVVDVVDGRTLLIETAKDSRVTFRLQYIEVPEAEQPLAEVVKTHLRDIAFGKTVNIRSNSISKSIIVGQVILNGVDLSQQMLRDGAAWFYNNGTEIMDDYQAMETAAKAEKRGVWGVEGLKPAWEVRKEKELAAQKKLDDEKKANEEKLKQQEQESQKNNATQKPKVNTQSGLNLDYVDPNLVVEYDRTTNESFVSSQMQKFIVTDDTNSLEVLLGFGYEFVGTTPPKNIEDFGIAVGSTVVGADLLRANEVTITTDDGKKLRLGKPKSKFTVQKGQIVEVLFYKIERAELVKLAETLQATIKLGKYQRVLDRGTLNIVNILLRPTN